LLELELVEVIFGVVHYFVLNNGDSREHSTNCIWDFLDLLTVLNSKTSICIASLKDKSFNNLIGYKNNFSKTRIPSLRVEPFRAKFHSSFDIVIKDIKARKYKILPDQRTHSLNHNIVYRLLKLSCQDKQAGFHRLQGKESNSTSCQRTKMADMKMSRIWSIFRNLLLLYTYNPDPSSFLSWLDIVKLKYEWKEAKN